jgi:hypothetical protein
MGNIVGEGFNKKITEQVIQRQKIYGSINRDNEQLSYLNARTGWCSLASGVSIDPQNIDNTATLRNLDLPAGITLARQYLLWSGTTVSNTGAKISFDYTYRSGIANDNSTFNTSAYGLGGTEYGIRPMPGIISAQIQTETRGSIKRATVKIQANNRQQFDIVDLLYMRLGYSVLLEWGNSSYYDNDGKYIEDNPYVLYNDFLSDNPSFTFKYSDGTEETQPLTYNTMLPAIQQLRIQSCGNYDAIFAKVVNFSWTFTKNGTYDITINLISLGDVIESLKTNTLLGGLQSQLTPSQVEEQENAQAGEALQEKVNSNIAFEPKY